MCKMNNIFSSMIKKINEKIEIKRTRGWKREGKEKKKLLREKKEREKRKII